MQPQARKLTNRYSGITAFASAVTWMVPGLDEVIVVPMHYRLVRRMSEAAGVPTGSLPWKQLRKIIWYGAAARLVGNFSIGFVPGIGMFSNAITAIALTEYLGRYLDDTLTHPDRVPPDVTMESLRQLFTAAIAKQQKTSARAVAKRESFPV